MLKFALPSRFKLASAVYVLLLLAGGQGCALVGQRDVAPVPPPNVPQSIPRELSKSTVPEYVIEPPDVLAISAISLVPKHPYRLRPLDTLLIQATGLPEDARIGGEFVIGLDGSLVLGFEYDELDGAYQPIRAVDKTIDEVRIEIVQRLQKIVQTPRVWITLVSIAAQQDVTGEHLVASDGRITLGGYGRVCVVGMTIEESKAAVEQQLAEYFENPQVSVDILGFNSKVYYVITQGAGLGDRVVPLPVKGGETALDAIGQIEQLSSNSSMRMWIARPGFNQAGGDQIMPIDWLGITQRGDVTTNYQLMPGDRLYVAEDKLVAIDTALAKFISPIERILGVTLLGTQAAERIATFGTTNRGVGF